MNAKRFQMLQECLKYIFLSIYAFISLYPIIWMAFFSLKNNEEIFVTNPFGFPTHFRVGNYIKSLSMFPVPKYFLNSLIVASITIAITIVIGFMFSYATARMQWKLMPHARTYITLGMFIPTQVVIIPLIIFVRDTHIIDTYWSLIIPYAAFNLGFTCVVFHGFLRTIPFEMEESAYMDGANLFSIIVNIILPLVRPAIVTMIIFLFLNIWNEFLLGYILISKESMKTISVGLLNFQGQFSTDWGVLGAALTLACLPTLAIYLFFSEQVEKAISVGAAIKG